METMEYIGEHTWAGSVGHGFAILSLLGALLALLGYAWGALRLR